ncbi:hypothetical protein [Streptomyces sp. NPDC002952]|uniref:hypothetical protein n=1 Tax=Streptomyces sp. NPDC002952 TaxID=3364673 RepID=UPI0036833C59
MLGLSHRRHRIVAAFALLPLLAACGADTDEGTPLDARTTRDVLPDEKAVPGWDITAEPTAESLKKARSQGLVRCYTRASCEDVRFAGVSLFQGTHKPRFTFMIMTYEDADTAESAYGRVWKAWKARVPDSRVVNVGDIGDQHDAVAGPGSSFDERTKSTLVQVRVGSALMLTTGESAAGVDMSDDLVAEFASTFAERARQVQDGEVASAAVDAG